MGKGGTTIQAPPQVDAAQAQGEYCMDRDWETTFVTYTYFIFF